MTDGDDIFLVWDTLLSVRNSCAMERTGRTKVKMCIVVYALANPASAYTYMYSHFLFSIPILSPLASSGRVLSKAQAVLSQFF